MEHALKVLIVDDSPPICQILSAQLDSFGVTENDSVHSGEAALEQLQENNFDYDALFIDLHMEGMNGQELIHHLNELDYRGAIIIVSALDTRTVAKTLEIVSNYHLKVLGSIEKPITQTAVAFMIRRLRHLQYTSPKWEDMPSRRQVEAALRNKDIITHFQPIITNHQNSIYALECLIRLIIEDRVVEPAHFLPVIDKFDLHDLFLSIVLEQAASDFKYITDEAELETSLSINVSPLQLYNDGLPEALDKYAARYDLDRHQIIIEISDNHAMVDDLQRQNLGRLRAHGFDLALDDYGSGYTNLKEIQDLPFNHIKLDSDIVRGLRGDKMLSMMVSSIQTRSTELGIELIAVGITDPLELIELEALDINVYQGYVFCRPRPADEVIEWAKNWKKKMLAAKAVDAALIAEKTQD